ncbi:hypothetical protein AB0D08_34830 [Kitasatospora sp. NPDC048540]|uniref:hypothetical protein n=1 Tax=unclassified Kitasatospora TaxID=2633591 RepID=UPI000539D3DE|nr:hypothetical protein [Kitasatospora sp. MBT63]
MESVELERGGEPVPAVKIALGGVLAAGVAGLVLFASASAHWAAALGGGLMVAATFAVGGGLLGFLFGVPRLLTSGAAAHPEDPAATSTASYAPNTNLEQVSDWLTKILLGAGLTQIGTVPQRLRELGRALAPVVGGGPGSAGFAAALGVYFSVVGFLSGWLLTRLLLAKALSAADRQTLADSVNKTVVAAPTLGFTPEQVRDLFGTGVEGLRVQALALLQGAPDARNLDLIVTAIDRHLSAFELLQALLAARAATDLPDLTAEQRTALRDAVRYKMRNSRNVPPYSRRRAVAEEVLRRLPEPAGAGSVQGGPPPSGPPSAGEATAPGAAGPTGADPTPAGPTAAGPTAPGSVPAPR